MLLKSINPANNKLLNEYEEFSISQTEIIINEVNNEFLKWKLTPYSKRSELLINAAGVLRKNIKEYSEIISLEMGKPIKQSVSEVEKCALVCEYYAENGEKILSDEFINTNYRKSFVSYQPIGIVLAVMPWNFPFWQVFRFAAPNLFAGNGALLKHASNVSGCALAIESVFREAGFPENIFRTLLINSSKVEKVISNKFVKAVTLTGSTPAGKSVASISGNNLKKTVLELGGSDPYIILEDANLNEAAKLCVTSRLINGGQSCIAAKRFIITEKVYDEFTSLFINEMNNKKMGDPFDESIDIGPQARVDLRDELHTQVLESINKGANLILGGKIPIDEGAFYPPSILENVKKGMPAYDDELFGPVAALIKVKNEEEAVYVANDSIFGLGAAIFTSDLEKGEKFAKEKIYSGSVFVNDFVKSDPRLPFGGINESGYGRELSPFGIKEFVNIKTVVVK